MKYIKNYYESTNPNTPDGYLNSLSKKPKLKQIQNQKPTDEVDSVLQDTEKQKAKIIATKDVIEKELLNTDVLEPDNKNTAKAIVNDYKTQITEFDKTVNQIDKLKTTLSKSNINKQKQQHIKQSRENNF
jgi:vacuolar-type H+-ATPase subunit I/STV1